MFYYARNTTVGSRGLKMKKYVEVAAHFDVNGNALTIMFWWDDGKG